MDEHHSDAKSLRRYVSLKVVGTEHNRFNPADLSRVLGIEATDSWRRGDPNPRVPRLVKGSDYWDKESSAGRSATLNAQVRSLFSELHKAWEHVIEALKQYAPTLQFVIRIGRDPVEFSIENDIVGALLQLDAEIDCDLYWVCDEYIRGGRCINCHIDVPSKIPCIQRFIGGEYRVAEFQARFTIYGIRRDIAIRLFDLDHTDLSRRLGEYNIDVCYLEKLECLQFSSDFLPTSLHIALMDPSALMDNFADAMLAITASIDGGFNKEFSVDLIERGAFQGSTDFHFDLKLLKKIYLLNAKIDIHLQYFPRPHFLANGKCVHCDIDIERFSKSLG